MKIFFDYQIFLLQKYGGVSTYYFNLANQLIKKITDLKLFHHYM